MYYTINPYQAGLGSIEKQKSLFYYGVLFGVVTLSARHFLMTWNEGNAGLNTETIGALAVGSLGAYAAKKLYDDLAQ